MRGDVFAHAEASGAVPVLQLAIPADATGAVVVFGAICASGTPVIDGLTATCSDGSLGRRGLAAHHGRLRRRDEPTIPDLVDAPFTLRG